MKNKFIYPVLTLFLLLIIDNGYAQRVVNGVVHNSAGRPIPFAAVYASDVQIGTTTDIDGKFSFTLPDNAKTLKVSCIGYKTETVQIGNSSSLNLTLNEEAATLNEVVVVGYGTMKRADLTGSISSIGAEEIQKTVAATIDQALQGRAAGIQVVQSSGMQGAAASVKIRGTASLNLTTEPLYVIDGIAIQGESGITNPLASINPADIVSMDILKDASATAIYGSRGANGVIIITTKRGQSGEAKVSYSGYVGWQEIPKHLNVLNLQQYAAHRNVLAENGMINYNNNFVRPELLSTGTDWQDVLFNKALMTSHSL